MRISITYIDTACLIIDINGFRILTDPVLDNAGGLYHFGYGSVSRKLNDPAISTDEIGEIDMVLLSHHQHQDNFDRAGKDFTKHVPLVISTTRAARKMSNTEGLEPWKTYSVVDKRVPGLKFTAIPARHHPWWLPEFFSGKVIGFIIEFDNQSEGAIYISGDTVLFDELNKVADKFKIDLAILHLGSVQFPYLTGYGKYTMNAEDGIELSKRLNAKRIMPVHTNGWSHFKESMSKARSHFDESSIADRTLWLEPAVRLDL